MLGPGFAFCRDGGGLGFFTRFSLFLALSLVVIDAQQTVNPASAEDGVELMVLAESDFLWDDDKWTVSGNASKFQHGTRMIKAADDGPDTWYFVAPGKLTGAKRAAYGGRITFKHGYFEYNRLESRLMSTSHIVSKMHTDFFCCEFQRRPRRSA
jgi:hypothetical protein